MNGLPFDDDLLGFHRALLTQFHRPPGKFETEMLARGVDEITAFSHEPETLQNARDAVALKFIGNDVQIRGLIEPFSIDGYHGTTDKNRIDPRQAEVPGHVFPELPDRALVPVRWVHPGARLPPK